MSKFLKIFIFFIISLNINNISKADEINAFCLIKITDLIKSGLEPGDHNRFAGKEIRFIINLEENIILDISEDSEVSVITGMYGPSDMREITKNLGIISYRNKINLNSDRGEVQYKYNNSIIVHENKPVALKARIDQSGVSFNKWNFEIGCRNYEHTYDEKIKAKKPNIKDMITRKTDIQGKKCIPTKSGGLMCFDSEEEKEEYLWGKKKKTVVKVPIINDLEDYNAKDQNELLYLYKVKFFNNNLNQKIDLMKGKKLSFKDIEDLNETDFFKIKVKNKGDILKKRRLKKEYFTLKEKL